MLRLLIEGDGREYPADYLLSRIRGRKVRLVPARPGEARFKAMQEEDDNRIWAAAATERQWLFRQMHSGLRCALAPLFVFFEIDTMARVIRYRSLERSREAENVLQGSILAPAIQKVMRGGGGVTEMLAMLEEFCADRGLPLEGLSNEYTAGGLRRSEEMMRSRFLTQVLDEEEKGEVLSFFQDMVDMRNILTVAKALRWKLPEVPLLLGGGNVRLRSLMTRVSADGLAGMIRRWTSGVSLAGEELHPARLEPFLLNHLGRKIHRRQRGGGSVPVCIAYIWQTFMAARDRSLLFHAGGEVTFHYVRRGGVS